MPLITGTSFNLTGLNAGLNNNIEVRSVNAEGVESSPLAAAVLTKPGRVLNLTATSVTATNTYLIWDSVQGAASYSVEVSADNISYTVATSVVTPSYTAPRPSGTTRYYRVYANNAAGSSLLPSNVFSTAGETPNAAPVVNAGADQTITLPTSSVTLTGSATDSDGTITSYAWTQQIGPNTATITSPGSATTTVTGLIQGTYTFRLTATDNVGATGYDELIVVVNPQNENITPTAPSSGVVNDTDNTFTFTNAQI